MAYQLAAVHPVDLAVLLVGAEPPVDLVQPGEHLVGEAGQVRLRQRVGEVQADRGTHHLLDPAHHAFALSSADCSELTYASLV